MARVAPAATNAPTSGPQARGTRWDAVAQRVTERRGELGVDVETAATRGGVDVATWERIERAARPGYRKHREEGVCHALGWSSDSIDRVLAGGEPRVAASPGRRRDRSAPWILRPLSTRGPDGRFAVCPARVGILGGIVIEVGAVLVFFRP